jgi:hypothetical protein
VGSLELSLKILVDLESVTHLIVNEKLVGDRKGDQELGSISLSLELLQACNDPEKDVLKSALLTMHHISLEVRVEVGGVPKDLQEAADALLSLILSLLLNIDSQVCVI